MPITVLPHMISRQSPVVGMEGKTFSDIALFLERAEKLAATQTKYQGIPISQFIRTSENGDYAFQANTPDVDDVVSLAVKFRFFYADKEPTQFQKILTNTRRFVQDDWACGYLDWISEQYKEAMRISPISSDLGYPVLNRKIIDLWFNSEFFHSEPSKREELRDIHAAIGDGPSLFQLYVAIAYCSSYIKMLYAVLHRLSAQHQFVYTPNHHFQSGATAAVGDV